jgi:hypothetical protein
MDIAGNALLSNAVREPVAYRRVYDQFRVWCERALDWADAESIDRSLSDYFAHLSQAERAPAAGRAGLVMSAVLHYHPRLGGQLPLAKRAKRSWEKKSPQVLSQVLDRDTVGVVAGLFAAWSSKHSLAGDAAVLVLVAEDCLFRGGEFTSVRMEDLSFYRQDDGRLNCAFELGRAERGEHTKTGHNEGVVVRQQWLAELVLEFYEWRVACGADAESRFWTISKPQFDKLWHAASEALGFDLGVPHVLRHTGASCLFEDGWKLTDIRHRGRWSGDSSVDRYTRFFALVQHRAARPDSLGDLARDFRYNPRGFLHSAALTLLQPAPKQSKRLAERGDPFVLSSDATFSLRDVQDELDRDAEDDAGAGVFDDDEAVADERVHLESVLRQAKGLVDAALADLRRPRGR